MVRFMSLLCSGAVSERVRVTLASSTVIPLWMKDEAARAELQQQAADQDVPYRPPIRPIGYSSALMRIASSCAMWSVRDHIAAAVGPLQFALACPAGTDVVQWIVQAAVELDSAIAIVSLDASNVYGMLDRRAIERRQVAWGLGKTELQFYPAEIEIDYNC
eukprot:jgi/Tetstr1/436820/TSEL_025598.t1